MNRWPDIYSALLDAVGDGSDVGRNEPLVFGQELDTVLVDAVSEIVRAREFLDLMESAMLRQPPKKKLDYSTRAMRGLAQALEKVAHGLGRYVANPASKMGSEERILSRWVEK